MRDGERFFGRRDELALLGRRLADARAGRGSIILVTGPAGIGKTGLVEKFVAAVGDMPLGWGGTTADEGMPPKWPGVRALRAWPDPGTALASALAGDAQQRYGMAEDAAATTFAADTLVIDAIGEQARASRGLLVVLDDASGRPTDTASARSAMILLSSYTIDLAGASLPRAISRVGRAAMPSGRRANRGPHRSAPIAALTEMHAIARRTLMPRSASSDVPGSADERKCLGDLKSAPS
jgi:hypothetical protein